MPTSAPASSALIRPSAVCKPLVMASDASLGSSDPPEIGHGAHLDTLRAEALRFLSERFYRSTKVTGAMREGKERIATLFHHLLSNAGEMPTPVRQRIDDDGLERVVCDYIAGMTDRFLLSRISR